MAIPQHIVEAVKVVASLPEDVYITDAAFKETYAHHVTTSTLYPVTEDEAVRLIGLFPSEEKEMKMLSVGCGTGLFDLPVMQRLKADGWKIDFTGVDPCEGASNQLKEEAIKEDLVASAQCYESTLENWCTEEKFDVITFSHCTYYMDNIETNLRKAQDMLKDENSKVYVFVTAFSDANLPYTEVMKQFKDVVVKYSEHVEEALEKCGIVYSKTPIHGIQSTAANENDEEVDAFLTFMTHIDFTRKFEGFDDAKKVMQGWYRDNAKEKRMAHPAWCFAYGKQ